MTGRRDRREDPESLSVILFREDRPGVLTGTAGSANELREESTIFILSYIKEIEMPRGRPTTDHKNNPIRVRLNEDMRDWIEKKSELTGITISQLIRDMIENEMKTK